jgi:hypothetical protein
MNFSTVPPELLQLLTKAGIVGLEPSPYILGVEGLGPRRRADDIREDGGDELALLAMGLCGLERRSAGTAKTEAFRVLGSARRAAHAAIEARSAPARHRV